MTCIKIPQNPQASLRHSVTFIYLLMHLIELMLYIFHFRVCIIHDGVVNHPVTATAQIYLIFVRSRPHRYPEALAHSQLKFLAVLPPSPRPPLLSLLHALAGCGIRISIRRPCPSIPAASLGASALKKKKPCICQRGPSKCTNECEKKMIGMNELMT